MVLFKRPSYGSTEKRDNKTEGQRSKEGERERAEWVRESSNPML
jgi:hypothetical protein